MSRLSIGALFSGLLLGVLLGFVWPAWAVEVPRSDLRLFVLLNGKPTKLGVLTSTGSSVSNVDAGTPFTITAGSVLKVECDAPAYVGMQATCHGTVTNANYCPLVDTRPAREAFIIPEGTASPTMAAISVSGTSNCMVWEMH